MVCQEKNSWFIRQEALNGYFFLTTLFFHTKPEDVDISYQHGLYTSVPSVRFLLFFC